MATQRDYYDLLGIPPSAPEDEIKRAYRRLAVELHPDRNPGDPAAEERFKRASQAYAVLSDPDKRRRYDRLGHSAFGGHGSGGKGGGLEPDLDAMGEVLGGLLGDLFRTKKSRRPRDLKLELSLQFEEAALGCEKTLELTRNVTCVTCSGSGSSPTHAPPKACVACHGKGEVRYQRGLLPALRACQACHGTGKHITHPCLSCRGEGVTPSSESLRITVPAGVLDGSVRSVRGAGEHTSSGQGDLHVTIRVEPHPLFARNGADVLCTVPITYPQAVLGDNLEVPTLAGVVRMRLPPGTESGRVFRLRGKGLPVFGGVGKGDQLVTVIVEIPQHVTKHQQELLEQLALDMGDAGLPARRSFRDKLRALFD